MKSICYAIIGVLFFISCGKQSSTTTAPTSRYDYEDVEPIVTASCIAGGICHNTAAEDASQSLPLVSKEFLDAKAQQAVDQLTLDTMPAGTSTITAENEAILLEYLRAI